MPAAIAVPAIIGGVSSLGGAAISAAETSKAVNAQKQAAAQALGYQKGAYDDAKTNLSPFITGGQTAFSQLMNSYMGRQGQPMTPYAPPPGIPAAVHTAGPMPTYGAPPQAAQPQGAFAAALPAIAAAAGRLAPQSPAVYLPQV